MPIAAIYARVSSDKQREDNTIASQTASLKTFAASQGYDVPAEWVIEDAGYSGATLVRPGLEQVRDLAAEGQIEAVLVYSPDRLSRRYAYQVLIMEELTRNGVATVFLNAPGSGTPEDELLTQFQSMIAEYERGQILERSRRGKRHRARQGEVNVLSGAPYGYRYLRKRDGMPASYEVINGEAEIVRAVYARYTTGGESIGAIARWLTDQGVSTRRGAARWERSTVWAMLRNPAYSGTACYGKTQIAPRRKVTKALRDRGGIASRNSANHERPRDQWIEVPVPAIVSVETFDLAQERLAANKRTSPRRTVTPSVVQGLVVCRKCGYAMSRTSTRTSTRQIHYYRCLGSDAWRKLNGPVCDNKPVRQDLLDAVVWNEVLRLLETPDLIQQELDRRLAAASAADPTRKRQTGLEQEAARVNKAMDRLVTAYQEDLLSIDELRQRMPALKQRDQTIRAERQAIADQAKARSDYVKLAETLSAFLTRLRSTADTLEVEKRQQILRLLVREVLVGDDTIVIRHSIAVPSNPTGTPAAAEKRPRSGSGCEGYLLRSGSEHTTLRGAFRPFLPTRHDPVTPLVLLRDRRLEPELDQAQDVPVGDALGDAAE
ncbi:recombinase family protein [Rhodovibrio sodomensis]|uniref:recombinase family protein n=1 Tax=Rhodovibrio sodomensis TaxID=1088 RepID=UPI001906FB9A|nr:recombinase family protein [Rhodovibrio sodomensis]